MLIDCVPVELVCKSKINIDTDGHVYGIETGGKIFSDILGKANVEMAGILSLDHTNHVLNYATVAIGNTNSVDVSVAQIIKIALLSNADKIMIAHNHPSGVLEITSEDINLTQRIGAAAKFFKIQLIDSLIVNAKGDVISIREKIGGNR